MALSEPFTVTTNQNPVAVKSSVPNSPSATLPDGKTSTFGVTIANNGPDDEVYFLDARQPTSTTEALAPTAGTTNTVQEPDSLAANTPPQSVYLVPTHTTQMNGQASTAGPQPIEFDMEGPAGDPDLASKAGPLAGSAFSANRSSRGCGTSRRSRPACSAPTAVLARRRPRRCP
jgi:hypothetical protein